MERSERFFAVLPRLVAWLSVAAYLAIQSYVLNAPLFPADDYYEYAHVVSLDSFGRLFGADAFSLFRPIKNLLFALFSCLMPHYLLMRLFAVAVGVGSYLCVLNLMRRLVPSRLGASCVAAVWLLSPTLVSSVAWLSCVNIQLMCAFAALALYGHDRDSWPWRGFATVMLFLALVSYENAVVVGPIVFVLDFYLRPARLRRAESWKAYGLYASVTLAYLVLRAHIGALSSVGGSFDGVNQGEMSFASAYFTLNHFHSWVWPFGRMTVFGSYSHAEKSVAFLCACWGVVLMLALAAWSLRRIRPLFAFGIAAALVGFVPVSNLFGLGNGPYGDYYLGVSAMGLSLSMVDSCLWALESRRFPWLGRIFVSCVATWVAACAIEAKTWAVAWTDARLAYAAGARNFPKSFTNHFMLAGILYNDGRYAEALRSCQRAEALLRPDSDQAVTCLQLRALLAMMVDGDADAAFRYLDRARAVAKPNSFESSYHYFRGCVFEDVLHDDARAIAEYERSLSIEFHSGNVDAANRLGRLVAIRGDLARAAGLWQKAARIAPYNATICGNLRRVRQMLPKEAVR